MSNHVFVVSEWLPKENKNQELWICFKKLLALTLEKEKGCLRAHVTKQISHPGAPSKTKFKMCFFEYTDIKAFDAHCNTEYVSNFFKKYIENKETAIVEDWQCRLFGDNVDNSIGDH